MFKEEIKDQIKLSWWPSPQDYNEAVQNPAVNADDPELKQGLVYVDALGIPRPVTGSFASVYRLKCTQRDVALRCFLSNIADQEDRYALISRFVQHDELPYTVMFNFLPRGIKVAGSWFPALKMDWVEGEALDRYILHNLTQPKKLERLAADFLKMMDELHAAGIAHGDLQHGNIIVLQNGELRLVDYDGMYVPGMENMKANELGHRNYQHPQRQAEYFDSSLDNFSAWIIYTSIIGLQLDSNLWIQLAAGDDCLLFRQSDFLRPESSPAFAALETHSQTRLQLMGRFIRSQLANSPGSVPYLQSTAPDIANIALLSGVSPIRQGPRLVSTMLPEWLADENMTMLKATDGQTSHFVLPTPAQWFDPSVQQKQTGAGIPPTLQSGASPISSYQIQPELLQPTPRAVEYSPNSEIPSPKTFQWLMLLNPLLWIAYSCFMAAMGPDAALIKHGQDYPAKIINASTYERKSNKYLKVDYEYTVNGHKYYNQADELNPALQAQLERDGTTVRALPENPECTEPFQGYPGQRQTEHGWWSVMCAVLCLVCEAFIWFPAMRHKKLARFGEGVPAEVLGKSVRSGTKGESFYSITVSYSTKPGTPVTSSMDVSSLEYSRRTKGDLITVLYDPDCPSSFMPYEVCRYRPVVARRRP